MCQPSQVQVSLCIIVISDTLLSSVHPSKNMSGFPLDYNKWMVGLTSEPPAIDFDVKFKFVNKQGEVQGEILGHKMLLALASPVFR